MPGEQVYSWKNISGEFPEAVYISNYRWDGLVQAFASHYIIYILFTWAA